MTDDVRDYGVPGPLTRLTISQAELCARLGTDPVAICAVAQGLVIEPHDAVAQGIAEDRRSERDIRSASGILDLLTCLDPAPLHEPRDTHHRILGTCRHFAVLTCALLRLRGIPARARCGFATYFVEGKNVDHWITEYWHGEQRRWVRVDSEILGSGLVADPADLRDGEFLTGGESWQRYRAGSADPALFGVAGVDYAWGVGEIRGNAIRDLAALRKIEMLPWDEWGRMVDSYQGRTGPDYDVLMDAVAGACATDDRAVVDRTYASEDLAVPEAMIV
jgi:Transglutaminase-like superfamily